MIMVKKAKLIYNPVSGKGSFVQQLDKVIATFQESGWYLSLYRTSPGVPVERFLADNEGYDAVLAAGGDGTIHQVVNAMATYKVHLPLGIFPVGTVNDFATYLGIPGDTDACARVVLQENVVQLDIGQVNDSYFLNVVSGGLLTDVPHTTPLKLKNLLGRLAYYAKGLEALPKFKPLALKIETTEKTWEAEYLLFLVLNSSAAGSFRHLAPAAAVTDGLLDVLLIKNCSLSELVALFFKLLKGRHVEDPNVIYFQTRALCISGSEKIISDLDGEQGPALPLEIRSRPHAIQVFVPKGVKIK